jgi:hypothetical protein
MGGTSSKVDLPEEPRFDTSQATVTLDKVAEFEHTAQDAVHKASDEAQRLLGQNSTLTYILWLVFIVIIGYLIYEYVYIPYLKDIFQRFFPSSTSSTSSTGVTGATGGTGYSSGQEYTPPNVTGSVYTGGLKDGTIMSTKQTSISNTAKQYSYQFWIFIKDWNYNFGKDKYILARKNPANPSIINPLIKLHPVDNVLQISISVYPNEQTSKNDPAPYENSSSTDDVFLCEVPNIPLQKWVSINVSVSTRNLDVYVDGNLSKSCLLSGIPKPITGDTTLNENGGFSGWLCNVDFSSNSLSPSDAQSFHTSGPPCNIPEIPLKGTFGYFDSSGKQVSNYIF